MPHKKQAAPTKKAARLKKPTKNIIALHYLMTRSLNKKEAAALYWETALPTTISELHHKHGLEFEKAREPSRPRPDGGVSHFTRYTLKESSKAKARALLGQYQMPEGLK
ncbi:hypothetical protein [Oceanospirillum linum]|uniref:Uncharacterized protein n=1 Tax=Oceanospirillum linum TaxID=966 RepID=A0A1T1H8N8_OCELI|nr:hypothetical protein [Oceanospirillum linum]OOV86202.1 hypothetical protein BTA35_0214580 [Oceanospirillum linum]SEG38324.1 hypothetical protein SAMN04489856_10966 [Oleiphilus messinensis]SMP32150.1 hypothetical protein SAMN06264348_10963 [Oceanospirillum linum]